MPDQIERLEYIEIDRLIPYANNARTHSDEQIKKIQASLREFGFVNPVLVDKGNGIIAGHGRVEAARREGLTEVPCVRIEHLTEAQKKAYILADNRLALDAGWNMDILKVELEELKELDFDIDLTGFNDEELSDLFGEESDEAVEDDYEVALPEEPKTKAGDIFQLGEHRLMCGDSTEKKRVEQLMNGRFADMVFTDPPWNVNYGAVDGDNAMGYKQRTIMNDFMGTEQFKNFMMSAFSCMSKSSKPGCMTYVVMSPQEWGNMMLTLADNEYHWSSTIIWNKDHLVMSRKDYHTKYEPIWYGWKGDAPRMCPLEDRTQSDVWDIKRPTKSEEHPTMKPVELVARAILNSSNKKALVLDLFGGSGTTMIAAEQTGRSAYLMELDPKYCDVIINRWETFTGQKAVKL
jgi:DNA modification methylase